MFHWASEKNEWSGIFETCFFDCTGNLKDLNAAENIRVIVKDEVDTLML